MELSSALQHCQEFGFGFPFLSFFFLGVSTTRMGCTALYYSPGILTCEWSRHSSHYYLILSLSEHKMTSSTQIRGHPSRRQGIRSGERICLKVWKKARLHPRGATSHNTGSCWSRNRDRCRSSNGPMLRLLQNSMVGSGAPSPSQRMRSSNMTSVASRLASDSRPRETATIGRRKWLATWQSCRQVSRIGTRLLAHSIQSRRPFTDSHHAATRGVGAADGASSSGIKL